MRKIKTSEITDIVSKLCIEASCNLNKDVEDAFHLALAAEESPVGKNVIETLLENARIAREEQAPMCQDNGMAVVFIEAGMDVHIYGGDLEEAVNEGVRQGYEKGYLRKSVVRDPYDRINTWDNTPAIVHYSIVQGDKLKITVLPKGFGGENWSAVKVFTPAAGIESVKKFIVDTVSAAGSSPCPPMVIGVGIGGTMEKCAYLSKKALIRPLGSSNPDKYWSGLEKELLEKINSLGIGPAGLGGRTTALGVNIETFATHIASLPAAVNIGCHANRHASAILSGEVS